MKDGVQGVEGFLSDWSLTFIDSMGYHHVATIDTELEVTEVPAKTDGYLFQGSACGEKRTQLRSAYDGMCLQYGTTCEYSMSCSGCDV